MSATAYQPPPAPSAPAIFRTVCHAIRAQVPEPEPQPTAQQAFDPLAPSRAACRALVQRYVSLAQDDSLADVLLIARDKVLVRDFAPEPCCTGGTLGSLMLRAGRPGLACGLSDPLRRDAMAFAMMRLQHLHGDVEPWRLYEEGFRRDEVEAFGLEAAQLAEAIERIIGTRARP